MYFLSHFVCYTTIFLAYTKSLVLVGSLTFLTIYKETMIQIHLLYFFCPIYFSYICHVYSNLEVLFVLFCLDFLNSVFCGDHLVLVLLNFSSFSFYLCSSLFSFMASFLFTVTYVLSQFNIIIFSYVHNRSLHGQISREN